MEKPNELLVEKLMNWLGMDGVSFFEMCMEEYNDYIPVWSIPLKKVGFYERSLPHSVHLREGMAVRNFLRGEAEKQGLHEFEGIQWDDVYVDYIDEAVKLCQKIRKEVKDGKAHTGRP